MHRLKLATSVAVVYFPDRSTGLVALRALENAVQALDILDAVVMRLSGGILEIIDTPPFHRQSLLAETIFPADILAVAAVGPGAGAADDHFRDQGFDRNLLKEIGENIPPGGAALVALVEEKWIGQFADAVDPQAEIARFGKQTVA